MSVPVAGAQHGTIMMQRNGDIIWRNGNAQLRHKAPASARVTIRCNVTPVSVSRSPAPSSAARDHDILVTANRQIKCTCGSELQNLVANKMAI